MSSPFGNWSVGDAINAVIAAIALAALFRPEFSRLLRKWVNRIDVFPKDNIEIGFSNFGPTFGLIFSVRASPNDQFVRNVSVEIVRRRDKATHKFDWAVVRPLTVVQPPLEAIQIATSFSVQASKPHSTNIQFHDRETRGRIDAPIFTITNRWQEFLRSHNIVANQLPADELEKLHIEFTKDSNWGVAKLYSVIEREFYWEAGSYHGTLVVGTFDPEKDFPVSFEFSLDEADVQRLRLNIVGIIRNACYMPNTPTHFLHPAASFQHAVN